MRTVPAIVVLFLPVVCEVLAQEESPASPALASAPWLQPRKFSDFNRLTGRSPFSLPTAEETAPAAQRYILTGSASIGDEEHVFVFDKNTQKRLMLTSNDSGGTGNALLELSALPGEKENMSAKVRIEGQVVDIRYAEAPNTPGQSVAGPQMPTGPTIPTNPAMQPGINPVNPSNPVPPRRVIRRRVISSQPGSPNTDTP